MIAQYSVASVDTTHKHHSTLMVSILKGCPFKFSLSDALGTEHLCHFRRQCHSSTHNRAMFILTMAGSYSRCITVIVFDQSVMDVSEGEYEHPRWNCATPAAYVLHYTYSIEPSCSFRRWWTRRQSKPRPKLILDYNFFTQ